MNILHINPDYPFTPLYSRMLESFSRQHSHTVYVPLAVGRQLPETDSAHHHRVVLSTDYREYHRLFYGWKSRKILRSLGKQLRVQDYNLVHAHFLFSAGGVAHALKKLFGIEYVVTVQNTDVNVFFKYGFHLRKVGLRILSNAHRIIFPNPAYHDFVLTRYVPDHIRDAIRSRSQVVPYGVDSFWLTRARRTVRGPKNKNASLLYVGKFTKNKNVKAVVEATKILHRRGVRVSLDLVGDGPTLPKIRKMVRGTPYVRLHGRIDSKDDLLKLYRQADIFLMPSFTETFGLVYVEAMSQGLPVLYTKGQGIDGYYPEGTIGYSVDPNSPSNIADRVEDVIQNYERISFRCIQEVQRFSWSEIAATLDQLYSLERLPRSHRVYRE